MHFLHLKIIPRYVPAPRSPLLANENYLGDTLSIRFTTGILKLPPVQIPLIMIGPGTGVAPFRALMAERFLSGATRSSSFSSFSFSSYLLVDIYVLTIIKNEENLLFFGCRSIKEDFYYRSEWEKYVSSGFLTLSVAASRDQVRLPPSSFLDSCQV